MTTNLLSVRVNSLICIGKLLDHMDKWQVIDDVLSWMNQIPSKVLSKIILFHFFINFVSGAGSYHGNSWYL